MPSAVEDAPEGRPNLLQRVWIILENFPKVFLHMGMLSEAHRALSIMRNVGFEIQKSISLPCPEPY